MHRPPRRALRAACWLLWLAAWAFASVAEEVSAPDARQVRAVVQGQLDALAADDAERAFSFASPGIRSMVGTPGRFMDMVRGHYPVVYRPATVAFLAPQWIDGVLVQPVQMTDAAGAAWLAIYTLERQPDASWRISGCQVEHNEGHAS